MTEGKEIFLSLITPQPLCLSVFSLIRSIRGIHLQALCMVALRSFVSTPTPLQTNTKMSCGENSLSEHISIINSLIAPLFLQEP